MCALKFDELQWSCSAIMQRFLEPCRSNKGILSTPMNRRQAHLTQEIVQRDVAVDAGRAGSWPTFAPIVSGRKVCAFCITSYRCRLLFCQLSIYWVFCVLTVVPGSSWSFRVACEWSPTSLWPEDGFVVSVVCCFFWRQRVRVNQNIFSSSARLCSSRGAPTGATQIVSSRVGVTTLPSRRR